MNRNITSWIVWALFGVITLSAVAQLGENIANQGEALHVLALIEDIGWSALMVMFALVGALIVSRQPGNAIGWLLFGPAIVMAVPVEPYVSQLTTAPADPSLLLLLSVWFGTWSWLLLIFPLLFTLVLFPTGRPPTPRWRWLILAELAMCALFIVFTTFEASFRVEAQTLGRRSWSIPNPIGFLAPDSFPSLWFPGMILMTLLSVASQVVRYRKAGLLEREQLKWLLFGGAFFAVVYIPSFLIPDPSFLWTVFLTVLPFALMAFPIAIGIAILHYRLWDIDVIIRKTLVYGVLTVFLGLVYFGAVTLLQNLLSAVSGQQSTLAIVISTLAIAALFNPLQRRVQGIIDRRFYRQKYDAEKALAVFGLTVRDKVDLESLSKTLLTTVEETMQPESVSVWLRERTE